MLGPDAAHALVVLSPWSNCPLAWFALTLGALLGRQGLRVTYLLNDLCDVLDAVSFEDDCRVIEGVLARANGVRVVRLSSVPTVLHAVFDEAMVTKAARSNAIWLNKGSLPVERVDVLQRAFMPLLQRSLPHLNGLFSSQEFTFIVAPGGMYGNTGLLVLLGEKHGVRVSTYDSGEGQLLLGTSGPAACQYDIAHCVLEAKALLGADLPLACEVARAHLERRRTQKQAYFTSGTHAGMPIQVLAAAEDTHVHPEGVLIPLNVEWDTAATGLHRFYRDDTEWVTRTVAFLLEQGDIDVVVRQHPATRIFTDGAQWMADELARRFGQHPRFHFIAAAAAVNSYQLLEAARVVLPLSSTIGVEAAMLGKPIVLESRAYYATLAFAEVCDDEATYFARVLHHARRPSTLPSEKVVSAELTYFFAAVANELATEFTPVPEDFAKWSTRTLEELQASPAIRTFVTALVEGVPVAALQARPKLAAEVALRPESSAPDAVGARLKEVLRSIRSRVPDGVVPSPEARAPWVDSREVPAVLASAWMNSSPASSTLVPPQSSFRSEVPLRKNFAKVTMGDGVQLIGVANIEIGEGSCIGDYAWLNVCNRDATIRMRLGINVLIGRQSMVSTGGFLEIGDHCLFGPRCSVVDADHGIDDITRPYGEQPATLGRSIVIEENCWLGAGAVVTGNLTVGRGSVIGANSLVTKDVEPFSIVVGSPARLVKLYDPVTKQWERIDGDADRVRVDEHRRQQPLPDRVSYRALLRRNSRSSGVVPIVAGRGEWL